MILRVAYGFGLGIGVGADARLARRFVDSLLDVAVVLLLQVQRDTRVHMGRRICLELIEPCLDRRRITRLIGGKHGIAAGHHTSVVDAQERGSHKPEQYQDNQ